MMHDMAIQYEIKRMEEVKRKASLQKEVEE